jgi:hypothetical protein
MQMPDSLATLTGIVQDPVSDTVSYRKKTFVTASGFALEQLIPTRGLGISIGARGQADDIENATGDPRWQVTATAQGGLVLERGPIHTKVIYSQGFRPPGADSLYSTVGTEGNPGLRPERSQEIAFEASGHPAPELTIRVGGNVTAISQLIVLVPVPPPSTFAYRPENNGSMSLASGFVEAQLASAFGIDMFANYHFTSLAESAPIGAGIPLAPHTAAFGAIWRAAPDLSLFARGTFSSPRHVRVMTAANSNAEFVTSVTVRTMVGATLANVLGPVALDIAVDNPLFLAHDSPYSLDGSVNGLIERRQCTEVFATLRYER